MFLATAYWIVGNPNIEHKVEGLPVTEGNTTKVIGSIEKYISSTGEMKVKLNSPINYRVLLLNQIPLKDIEFQNKA